MARKLNRTQRARAWIKVWRMENQCRWPMIKQIMINADVSQGTAHRALAAEKEKTNISK